MHTAVMSRGLRDTVGNARSGCSVRSRSRGGPPVLGDTHIAEMEEETEEQRRQWGDGRGRWGGAAGRGEGAGSGPDIILSRPRPVLRALRDLTSQPPPSLPPPQSLRSSAGDPRGARRCPAATASVCVWPGGRVPLTVFVLGPCWRCALLTVLLLLLLFLLQDKERVRAWARQDRGLSNTVTWVSDPW